VLPGQHGAPAVPHCTQVRAPDELVPHASPESVQAVPVVQQG
jgi:hypothetical protein